MRPKQAAPAVSREPLKVQLEELRFQLKADGETFPRGKAAFKEWLKHKAESELWFFSRWILGNDHLSMGDFHRREICPFLTDFTTHRWKLLMLPMGHLKSTLVSRSMPLHVLVQPRERNLYFPGMEGREARILLANENEQKCKENMDVLKRHSQENVWLRWLWPQVFWDDPQKQSPRWTDFQLEFKRTGVWAEPSITILGVKTGFIGKYYDMILPDDICGPAARSSPKVMETAKKWWRASKTRFYMKTGPRMGIHIGIGTHWGADDVFVEWQKDPQVQFMRRSVEEAREEGGPLLPIWPEKYSPEVIENIRKSTDPIDWALWWMNKPVSAGYTALNWNDLREYTVTDGGRTLVFADSIQDERIQKRLEVKARNLGFHLSMSWDPKNAKVRTRAPHGMDSETWEYFRMKYPDRVEKADG